MNNFEERVIERLSRVENDLSFIKGELSGRNHKDEKRHSWIVLVISIGALLVAVASVFIRVMK